MTVIVRDDGFHSDDHTGPVMDIAADTAAADLPRDLDGVKMIRITFPGFGDGRGFTLARMLRAAGYRGRLRAAGPLIADQYAMARRSGFDDVEIPDDIAARQDAPQWRARADWRAHDYRARLSGQAAPLDPPA